MCTGAYALKCDTHPGCPNALFIHCRILLVSEELLASKIKLVKSVKEKCLISTCRPFHPKPGLPRGGGVKKILYLQSNR